MEQTEQREAVAKETGTDPLVIASGASVVIALYSYFIRGNKELGIFVGLWPPTILAFASYFNQLRMQERLEHIAPTGRLAEAIDQVMGRR